MTKILSILFTAFVLLSCKDGDGQNPDGNKQEINSRSAVDVQMVKHLEKNRLFLNIYSGMSYPEYINAIVKSVKSKKLIYYEKSPIISTSLLVGEHQVLVKDTILNPKDFIFWKQSILYPLTIEDKIYFTQLYPLIEDGTIIGLKVYGPLTNSLRAEIGQKAGLQEDVVKFKKNLIELYKLKFGQPKIESRIRIKDDDFFDLILKGYEDKNNYIFQHNDRTAIISQFGQSGYSVEYWTTTTYNERKSLREASETEQSIKTQNKAEKTFSDL